MSVRLTTSPFQARFEFAASDTVAWSGLHGSSVALATLAAANRHDGLVLLVTRSNHQARILEQDLSLFNETGLPIWHFPDRETLPYDPYSAHPDIFFRAPGGASFCG